MYKLKTFEITRNLKRGDIETMLLWMIVIIMIIIAFIVAIIHSLDENARRKDVTKTKMINVRQTGASGIVNQTFLYETTFIVYYKDGTHTVETVSNNSAKYRDYLKKLEV